MLRLVPTQSKIGASNVFADDPAQSTRIFGALSPALGPFWVTNIQKIDSQIDIPKSRDRASE
jgi:hypothetical protein